MADIPEAESIRIESAIKQESHRKSTEIQPIQDILKEQFMDDISDKPAVAVTDVSENETQMDIKLYKETYGENDLTEYEEEISETEGDISNLDANLLIQSLIGFDSSDG